MTEKTEAVSFPIVRLTLSADLQPPMRTSAEVVEEYLQAYLDNAVFPPVVAYYDGAHHWLADGFHRVRAAELAGRSHIQTVIHAGTKRDALRHAAGANAHHGLPRSAAVKRWYVRQLLADKELAKGGKAEIARICRVSGKLVEQVQLDFLRETNKPRDLEPRQKETAQQIADAGGTPEVVETPDGVDVVDSSKPMAWAMIRHYPPTGNVPGDWSLYVCDKRKRNLMSAAVCATINTPARPGLADAFLRDWAERWAQLAGYRLVWRR